MSPWKLPFQRWSMSQHGLAAALVVVFAAFVAGWWKSKTETAHADLSHELRTLTAQLSALPRGESQASRTEFTHTLPSASGSHDVVHDISGYAQSSGVQIDTLAVESRPASPTEMGKVQFTLAANAEYRALKSWLAKLLARYPTLGVQSLTLRPMPNDATRLDLRVSLVFFVKD